MDWKLLGHQATTAWQDTTASINTLDLRTGLTLKSGCWQGTILGELPAMQPPLAAASVETYVRGTDLVTTHPATTERPTRVQLYWRRWHGLPDSISAALELIISVQTHLLDSDPTIVIESRFPGAQEANSVDDCCEIIRGEKRTLILGDLQDGLETELIPDAKAPVGFFVRHTLFRQRLEKGVILRGRLFYCWTSQAGDSQAVAECKSRFLTAAPMLTA